MTPVSDLTVSDAGAVAEGWLTEQEVADRYGVPLATIRNWRRQHSGPVSTLRDGIRRYAEVAVAEWEASLPGMGCLPAAERPRVPRPAPVAPLEAPPAAFWPENGPGTLREPPGWVYVIGSSLRGIVKIGYAFDVELRMESLQTGSPVRLWILWKIRGTPLLERRLHDRFAAERIHGEHFDFGDADPMEQIREAVSELAAARVRISNPEPLTWEYARKNSNTEDHFGAGGRAHRERPGVPGEKLAAR